MASRPGSRSVLPRLQAAVAASNAADVANRGNVSLEQP